jgi:hypothetical protein
MRIPSPALHACVVGVDDDFAAVHDADAADDARAGHFAAIGLVRRERREFEEGRAGIEQQFDAVAHEHLVLPLETLDVARGTCAAGRVLALLQSGHKPLIVRDVEAEFLRAGIEAAVHPAHVRPPLPVRG